MANLIQWLLEASNGVKVTLASIGITSIAGGVAFIKAMFSTAKNLKINYKEIEERTLKVFRDELSSFMKENKDTLNETINNTAKIGDILILLASKMNLSVDELKSIVGSYNGLTTSKETLATEVVEQAVIVEEQKVTTEEALDSLKYERPLN